MKHVDRLAGQVAVVAGGGTGLGRDLALALGARGVRVVVTGMEERALGDTVGEIACGGGKARHLVGDVRSGPHLQAALKRAVETFGRADAVLVGSRAAMTAAAGSMAGAGALLVCVVASPGGEAAADTEWARDDGPDLEAFAARLQGPERRCHAVRADRAPDAVLQVLLLLAKERA